MTCLSLLLQPKTRPKKGGLFLLIIPLGGQYSREKVEYKKICINETAKKEESQTGTKEAPHISLVTTKG